MHSSVVQPLSLLFLYLHFSLILLYAYLDEFVGLLVRCMKNSLYPVIVVHLTLINLWYCATFLSNGLSFPHAYPIIPPIHLIWPLNTRIHMHNNFCIHCCSQNVVAVIGSFCTCGPIVLILSHSGFTRVGWHWNLSPYAIYNIVIYQAMCGNHFCSYVSPRCSEK